MAGTLIVCHGFVTGHAVVVPEDGTTVAEALNDWPDDSYQSYIRFRVAGDECYCLIYKPYYVWDPTICNTSVLEQGGGVTVSGRFRSESGHPGFMNIYARKNQSDADADKVLLGMEETVDDATFTFSFVPESLFGSFDVSTDMLEIIFEETTGENHSGFHLAALNVQATPPPTRYLDVTTIPLYLGVGDASLEEEEPPPSDVEYLDVAQTDLSIYIYSVYLTDLGVPGDVLYADTERLQPSVSDAEIIVGGLVVETLVLESLAGIAYWFDPTCEQRFDYVYGESAFTFRVSLRSDFVFELQGDGPITYHVSRTSTLDVEEYES